MAGAQRFGHAAAYGAAISRSVAANLYAPAAALELGFTPPKAPQSIVDAERALRRAQEFLGERGGPEVERRYARYLELLELSRAPAGAGSDLEAALQNVAADSALAILGQSPHHRSESLACIKDRGRDRTRLHQLQKDQDRELNRLLKAAHAHGKLKGTSS